MCEDREEIHLNDALEHADSRRGKYLGEFIVQLRTKRRITLVFPSMRPDAR